jgi:geranylgeranyl pyrophosphate synthase
LTDDILDFEADEKTLGKPVLSDLCDGTLTLPAIHALREGGDEARKTLSMVVDDGGFDRISAEEAVDVVRRFGGLDAARAAADDAAARARLALAPFPDCLSKQALQFATDFTVTRSF